MNKYHLGRLNDINDVDDVADVADVDNVADLAAVNAIRNGKKIVMVLLLVLAVAVPVAVYLFSAGNEHADVEKVEKAEKVEKVDKGLVENMLNELQMEHALMEQEKQRLAEQQRNLKNFESELAKKNSEYLQKAQQLSAKELEFNSKVELRSMDRQAIETYENIDSEQAAVLLKKLFEKDPSLVMLITRKISGKKAGRILEAMILLDKEIATKIAQDALNYYRPK